MSSGRRWRKPRSWLRPSHLGGGADAESSPALVCRGESDAKARKRPTLSPACPLTPAQQQTASELPGTANGYWSTATPRNLIPFAIA